jgi:hypothetical protein
MGSNPQTEPIVPTCQGQLILETAYAMHVQSLSIFDTWHGKAVMF